MTDTTPDEAIIERIQKILALGRRGGTEAEAASAMAKFQELLARHNLDLGTVERGGKAGDAKREQASTAGGMYIYQRELWRAVAELNFCAYFLSGDYIKRRVAGLERYAWIAKHAFIGRVVNTRATLHMGQYLESAIERLCRERLEQRLYVDGAVQRREVQSAFFSSWAVGFREGAADRVVQKLAERRERTLRSEAAAAKRRAAAAGDSTATALTLRSVGEQEEAANYDFRWGEGSWAEKLQHEAERAAARKRERDEWTAFKAANPEESRKMEEAALKERRGRRYSAGPTRKVNGSGYIAGSDAGNGIGLDVQADSGQRQQRRLR
jgi:hypothetical protein